MERVRDMPGTPEYVMDIMDKITAKYESKIMRSYYSIVGNRNRIYIEFLLKNVKGEIITKPELNESYVIRFEAINKGRLIVSIDLDLEEQTTSED